MTDLVFLVFILGTVAIIAVGLLISQWIESHAEIARIQARKGEENEDDD